MSNNYLCPHCKGQLEVNNNIIFGARSKNKKNGLVILSSKIGDYTIQSHPDFEIKEGDLINFFCPICSKSLHASNVNKNLAKVEMVDAKSNHFDIYFSGVVGEKCTYIIKDKAFEAHGDNKSNYLNFFNLSSFK